MQSDSFETPVWSIIGSDAAPDELLEVVPFAPGTLPVYGGPRQIAPAPGFPANVDAKITSDTITNDTRTITLEATAPQTDRLIISFDAGAPMSAITLNGETFPTPGEITNLVCSGRSCRNFSAALSFPVNDAQLSLDLLSLQFGLGPEGAALVAARPDWTIPKQRGDARYTHIQLSPDQEP